MDNKTQHRKSKNSDYWNRHSVQSPYNCPRDCKDRKVVIVDGKAVSCHATCDRYKKYYEWNEAKKEVERREREAEQIVSESIRDTCIKNKRNVRSI